MSRSDVMIIGRDQGPSGARAELQFGDIKPPADVLAGDVHAEIHNPKPPSGLARNEEA
jgi:hypothetical protein